MPELYIGLMSGTSMDAIDAVLVKFGDRSLQIVETCSSVYPADLRRRLRDATAHPERCGIDELGELDTWVAECFRDTALNLLATSELDAAEILAIGSHGQTVRHRPDAEHRFTLQLGNPALIATSTGITTVADFRRADVALGGEGAPLVPPFHAWLFGDRDEHRAVLNIGGIANVTVLPSTGDVSGFDTGPGNTLLDAWVRARRNQDFDRDGRWAASGQVDAHLLERLLADPWFQQPPPKSTGVEQFNLDWLAGKLDGEDARDVQATLSELTAISIAAAIARWAPATARVHVCGGGFHNEDLMRRLAARLGDVALESTSSAGVEPDWVEAAAFAWLAKRHLDGLAGNLPAVTGATRETVLGACYPPRATAH